MLIRYYLTSFITLFLLYSFFAFPSLAENKKNNLLHLLNTPIDLFKTRYSCAPTFLTGRKNMRKNICIDTSSGDTFFIKSLRGKLVSLTAQSENFEVDFETFLAELELPLGCSKNPTKQNSLVYECPDKEFVIVNFVENEFLFETEYCQLNFCKSNLSF